MYSFFTASQRQPNYQEPQQVNYHRRDHDISPINLIDKLRRVSFNQRLFEPYNRISPASVNNRLGFHQPTGYQIKNPQNNLFNQQQPNFYNPINQQVNKQSYQYDNLGRPHTVEQQSPQQPPQQPRQLPSEENFNLPEINKFNEPSGNNCTVTSSVNTNRPRIEGLPIDDEDCDGDLGNRINPNALKSLIG